MSTTDKDKVSNIDDITQDKIDGLNLNINWDNIINYKCSHLLPCGVCEITNKYCPLYNWQPSWCVDGFEGIATPEPWRVDGTIATTPKCACIHNTNEEEKKND